MSLLTDLKRGRGGVRLAVPARLTVGKEDEKSANLHDAARGVAWHLSRYEHHLDLRPEHYDGLVRDVERHTRALFETYARHLPPHPLRTKDPVWSPVVSVERVQVDGRDALTVIHRMSYQPGNEMLMRQVNSTPHAAKVTTGRLPARDRCAADLPRVVCKQSACTPRAMPPILGAPCGERKRAEPASCLGAK
jgi:hypothetical protein